MFGSIVHCLKHAADPIGVCTYCGRGMCRDCNASLAAARLKCSAECDKALARNARAIQSLLDKNAKTR